MTESNRNRIIYVLISLILPSLIVLFKPFNMDISQSIVLGSLLLTIIWWGSGIVNRDFASIMLLTVFVIFGRTPFKSVMYFPLSDNIILIVASFLLSQGIVNSKVADRFSRHVLSKYCDSVSKLTIMSFILGILLIFIIPQPFPRVILLSSIYMNFIRNNDIAGNAKDVIIFSIFAASTVTSMLFLNGDIILNYAALKFGGIDMTYIEWIKYMTLPGLLATVLVAVLFVLTFRKDIVNIRLVKRDQMEKLELGRQERIALTITLAVILLWLTEPLHSISPAITALIGTAAMFVTGIVGLRDFRAINISLLIFLTAEFSIGKVMIGSGVAYRMSDYLVGFFPETGSLLYIPFIIILVMVLHMTMGSLITSLSVIIPSLVQMVSGHLPVEVVVLLTYVSVNIHYLLPFHHVTVMIGFGNGYYGNRHTLKLGLGLTILTFAVALLIFIPWWRVIGLL